MKLEYFKPMLADELARHGIPDGWAMGVAGKVRYAELDTLNHVNNTTYFQWYEAIRAEYMSLWNVSDYSDPTDARIVVHSTSCRYHKEMLLGEDYIVTARTTSFRNSSFIMDYAVFAPDLRAEGSAVVVLLQADSPEKYPIPERAKQRFIEIDGATPGENF